MSDDVEEQIEELVMRPAYRPVYVSRDSDEPVTKLGGAPWLGPDAPQPTCDSCGRALAFIAQLDLGTLPAGAGEGLVQIFACESNRCGPEQNLVRLVRAQGRSAPAPAREPQRKDDYTLAPAKPMLVERWQDAEDDHPYPGDEDFDAIVAEHPDLEEAFEESSEGWKTVQGDKAGGWPYWHEAAGGLPKCSACEGATRLLVQLDYGKSQALPEFVGIAFVTQCPDHPEELALSWTT